MLQQVMCRMISSPGYLRLCSCLDRETFATSQAFGGERKGGYTCVFSRRWFRSYPCLPLPPRVFFNHGMHTEVLIASWARRFCPTPLFCVKTGTAATAGGPTGVNPEAGGANTAGATAPATVTLPTAAAGGGSSGGKAELDLGALGRALSAKMVSMPRDGHGSCKAVLQGCLELLRDLVEIEGPDGTFLKGAELGQVGSLLLFLCFAVCVVLFLCQFFFFSDFVCVVLRFVTGDPGCGLSFFSAGRKNERGN